MEAKAYIREMSCRKVYRKWFDESKGACYDVTIIMIDNIREEYRT